MSLDQKTIELANAVKETEEYKNLNSAHARLRIDVTAQDIVTQVQTLQEEIEKAQVQGNPVEPGKMEQLKSLHDAAGKNETLANLFKSQESFNALMQSVSAKISEELYEKKQ